MPAGLPAGAAAVANSRGKAGLTVRPGTLTPRLLARELKAGVHTKTEGGVEGAGLNRGLRCQRPSVSHHQNGHGGVQTGGEGSVLEDAWRERARGPTALPEPPAHTSHPPWTRPNLQGPAPPVPSWLHPGPATPCAASTKELRRGVFWRHTRRDGQLWTEILRTNPAKCSQLTRPSRPWPPPQPQPMGDQRWGLMAAEALATPTVPRDSACSPSEDLPALQTSPSLQSLRQAARVPGRTLAKGDPCSGWGPRAGALCRAPTLPACCAGASQCPSPSRPCGQL